MFLCGNENAKFTKLANVVSETAGNKSLISILSMMNEIRFWGRCLKMIWDNIWFLTK